MKRNQILSLVVISVMTAGCSTKPPDDLGTQIGTITEIFDVGVEPADLPDCRVSLNPEELATGRYMQVHFMSYGYTDRSMHLFRYQRSLKRGTR
jgi:hypothetical protein